MCGAGRSIVLCLLVVSFLVASNTALARPTLNGRAAADIEQDASFADRPIGDSILEPHITVTPDSFHAELITGQIEHQLLTITNAGTSDLHWEITITDTVPLELPVIGVGGSSGYQLLSFLHDSQELIELFTFIQVSDYSSDDLSELDGLIITSNDNSITVSRARALREFHDSNRPVILAMNDLDENWFGEIPALLEPVFGIAAPFDAYLCGQSTLNHMHPISTGIDTFIAGNNWCYSDSDAFILSDAEWLVHGLDGEGCFVAAQDGNPRSAIIGENLRDVWNTNAQFNTNVVKWTMARVGWLGVYPFAGTLSAGASQVVDVNFSADGLAGEAYFADIRLVSNDPLAPQLLVPTRLDVIGAADIALSETAFEFGAVFIGTTEADTLLVGNDGVEPLTVMSMSSYNPVFSADPSSFTLDPSETISVVLVYAPTSAGTETGIITVASDDPDEPFVDLTLRGEGVISPEIAVVPDSLYSDLAADALDTQSITISNYGGSELTWSSRSFYNDQRGQSRQLGFYADLSRVRNHPRPDFSVLPQAGVAEQDRIESRGAGDMIAAYTGFPRMVTGMTWVDGELWGVDWDDYQLFRYDLATESVTFTTLIHEEPFSMSWDGEQLWIGDPVGNIFAYDLSGNLVGSFSAPFVDYPVLAWDGRHLLVTPYYSPPRFIYVVEIDGTTVDTYSYDFSMYASGLAWVEKHQNGRLWSTSYQIDNSRQYYLDGTELEIVQTISFLHTGEFGLCHDGVDLWISGLNGATLYQVDDGIIERQWLSTQPASGSVPAGESRDVDVLFDSVGLYGGDYFAGLRILSNDPQLPEFNIAAHMHVSGEPRITLSTDFIDFGTLLVGDLASESLIIGNDGTDRLIVSSVTIDHPDFSVQPDSFNLDPETSIELTISYSPQTVGAVVATLTIASNDADEPVVEVSLLGEGVHPPIIEVAPDSLHVILLPHGIEVQTLSVANMGGSDLDWMIAITSSPPDFPTGRSQVQQAPDQLVDLNDTHILFDRRHGQTGSRSSLISDLISRGATVTENNAPLTAALLEDVGIFWSLECNYVFNLAELAVLTDWVGLGGSLLFEGDQQESIFNTVLLTLESGFVFSETDADSGLTDNIYVHDSTSDVSSLFIPEPLGSIDLLGLEATPLFDDLAGTTIGACSNSAWGRIVGISDELFADDALDQADNRLFGNQVIDWLAFQFEWIAVVPESGTIPAGSSSDLDVIFDATDQGGGSYSAEIQFLSNDPAQPLLSIPVTMVIEETTPVILTQFAMVSDPGRVSLNWELDTTHGDGQLELRAKLDDEEWIIEFEEIGQGRFEAIDEAEILADGGTVIYQLSRLQGTQWQLLRSESIEVVAIIFITELLNSHPNPFNPRTSIVFTLDQPKQVRIAIYDVAGRLIRSLAQDRFDRGYNSVVWNGHDDAGGKAASGIYFVKMRAEGFGETRKLVLLR